MYGDEFRPLTSSYGNTNGDIAHLRNVFVSAEMDYLTELLNNEDNRELLIRLLEADGDILYDEAKK